MKETYQIQLHALAMIVADAASRMKAFHHEITSRLTISTLWPHAAAVGLGKKCMVSDKQDRLTIAISNL